MAELQVYKYRVDYTTPDGEKDTITSTIWAESKKDALAKIEPMYEDVKDAKVTIGDVVDHTKTKAADNE